MIIGKIDVVRSTIELDKRGHAVTVAIRAQIDALVDRLLTALPNERAPNLPQRFRGERHGDGVMIGAPREHALVLLREAMTIRDEPPWQHPGWFPLRMAFGIATVSWDAEAFGKYSIPNGRDIVIVSRLLETECPAGSIVINETLLRAVQEYDNALSHLFERRSAELRGIEGPQVYGIMPPRAHPRFAPVLTRWKRLVQGPCTPIALTLGAVAWGFLGWWWLW